MTPRRPELPERPFDYEEAYAELAEQMKALHISRVAEMPRIELYLDQVLSIVALELSFMYDLDEKIVTGAMVNNYVKQHIVLPPVKKRYTRRHLASLLFVCAFKKVLSIAQIAQIFVMGAAEGVNIESAYDGMIDMFERVLAGLFPEDSSMRPMRYDGELCIVNSDGDPVSEELERLLENAVFLLAYKVHADQMLALEARRLQLAD